MQTPLVEKFVALSAADYIEGYSLQNMPHLKNGVVAVGSDYLVPKVQEILKMNFDPMQFHAAQAIATGAGIYIYNWLMQQPESTTAIAKKALVSQGLIYGYQRFK